ncbi:glycogen debranching protein GlgX [Micromonospora sp. SCSIO 07396]
MTTAWSAAPDLTELRIRAGEPLPYGATRVANGINFSVHSRDATAVTLVLFRRGAATPFAELSIPDRFRVGDVYAMTVGGLDPANLEYGYRVDGPYDPARGHRFDPNRILTDPYARVLGGSEEWGRPHGPGDPYPYRARVAVDDFDWGDDRPPRLPLRDLVVYEVHVRGFTRHPSSGVLSPGTFAGLVEKIPYLRALGVNCVELMPAFEFDECANDRANPLTGGRLYNYWGYDTVGFFAPKASYAASARADGQVAEFKALVKAMHRAGIEVLLDVVFNHTAEGDERGPAISFRGLDNRLWYLLGPDGSYRNFSGTGNTLNSNDPVVRGFVLDCLRYWVTTFHVDGFRFDLASTLTRGVDGAPMGNPPLIEAISADPVLRDCKLIAEAWDAGGLYQVGSFPHHHRWAEWNGPYRDAVRRFLRGDPGSAGEVATRLIGSPDLYPGRGPLVSVNFVSSHDGLTLHDLFAYDGKHNAANGEDGRDGGHEDFSWNCGHEGPTDDPEIRALRGRQARNALLLLFASHGIPMITAGDELGRTQRGNNNAYCHDGELSWLDWDLVEENADLVAFTREVIALRRAHPALRSPHHLSGADAGKPGKPPGLSWHGEQPWTPQWHLPLVAVMIRAEDPDGGPDDVVYLAANAHWEPARLRLPEPPSRHRWALAADTAVSRPAAVRAPGHETPLTEAVIDVAPRSVVLLTAIPEESEEQ